MEIIGNIFAGWDIILMFYRAVLQSESVQVGSNAEKKLQERGRITGETTLLQDQCSEIMKLWQISPKSSFHHLENNEHVRCKKHLSRLWFICMPHLFSVCKKCERS
jgi:hypothetical protein